MFFSKPRMLLLDGITAKVASALLRPRRADPSVRRVGMQLSQRHPRVSPMFALDGTDVSVLQNASVTQHKYQYTFSPLVRPTSGPPWVPREGGPRGLAPYLFVVVQEVPHLERRGPAAPLRPTQNLVLDVRVELVQHHDIGRVLKVEPAAVVARVDEQHV